jgi:hypothetical protein
MSFSSRASREASIATGKDDCAAHKADKKQIAAKKRE